MAFFEHTGDRYYYFDAGAGTPVVLLHGLANTGRAWGPQASALVQQGYRVIIPDLLGHGASGPVARVFTAREQAVAIIALLQHLELESASFAGLSLGGMVALEIATQHPRTVDKLVVAGTFKTMATLPRQRLLNSWIEVLLQPDGCLTRFETSWSDLVGVDFAQSPQGLMYYQAWQAHAAIQAPRGLVQWCEGMKFYDAGPSLNAITAPTLVLAGASDPLSSRAEAQDITDLTPGASMAVVPGGGHVFNVSSAEAFNQHLIEFLGAG